MSLYRSVISSKGQLVIPSEIRKQLGLEPGTGVSLELEGDRILLVPDSKLHLRDMKGWLKGKSSMFDYVQQERKREKDNEDR